MKNTAGLLAMLMWTASVSGADIEVKKQERLGVNTDFTAGGVRIVNTAKDGKIMQGGGVQVTAKVKAPIRNVNGLSASLKVEEESELLEDITSNGRHKVAVTPELEMKHQSWTVRGSTDVVRLAATKLENEKPVMLYTDYARPTASVDYATGTGVSMGMKYRLGQTYDPDQILTENKARQYELRRAVNDDHEIETSLKYRDQLMGLGLAVGYNFGKQTSAYEAPQTWSAKMSGDIRATRIMGVSGEMSVDTAHQRLERFSGEALKSLRYGFSVGAKVQTAVHMNVGALAKLSLQNKGEGRHMMKQTFGVSTSIAL